MDIISRDEWGARRPRARSTTSWGSRTEVVVHYSAGPTGQSVRSIQDFHMDGNGWSDIGYNFLVDTGGRVYEGRGWLVVGAHAPGHNTSGIGVCMIGRDGDATGEALSAIRWVYDEACDRAGRTLRKLGHRDVYNTSCPGDELYEWVRDGMPAEGGLPAGEEDPLIGLKKGDSGQAVVALQELIKFSGFGHVVGDSDGDYGPKTSEGLLAVRKSIGSSATSGDHVDGWAYSQLLMAMARRQGKDDLSDG